MGVAQSGAREQCEEEGMAERNNYRLTTARRPPALLLLAVGGVGLILGTGKAGGKVLF